MCESSSSQTGSKNNYCCHKINNTLVSYLVNINYSNRNNLIAFDFDTISFSTLFTQPHKLQIVCSRFSVNFKKHIVYNIDSGCYPIWRESQSFTFDALAKWDMLWWSAMVTITAQHIREKEQMKGIWINKFIVNWLNNKHVRMALFRNLLILY